MRGFCATGHSARTNYVACFGSPESRGNSENNRASDTSPPFQALLHISLMLHFLRGTVLLSCAVSLNALSSLCCPKFSSLVALNSPLCGLTFLTTNKNIC